MILSCLHLAKSLKTKKAKKRIIRMASSDSEDGGGSPIHRPAKRARPIESVDLETTQISEAQKDKRILFLQEAFPRRKRRVRYLCPQDVDLSVLVQYVYMYLYELLYAVYDVS